MLVSSNSIELIVDFVLVWLTVVGLLFLYFCVGLWYRNILRVIDSQMEKLLSSSLYCCNYSKKSSWFSMYMVCWITFMIQKRYFCLICDFVCWVIRAIYRFLLIHSIDSKINFSTAVQCIQWSLFLSMYLSLALSYVICLLFDAQYTCASILIVDVPVEEEPHTKREKNIIYVGKKKL